MTLADLDNLKQAYYSGVMKAREGDTWVEFHSMKEMRIAIQDAEAELAGKKPLGTRLVGTSKGY